MREIHVALEALNAELDGIAMVYCTECISHMWDGQTWVSFGQYKWKPHEIIRIFMKVKIGTPLLRGTENQYIENSFRKTISQMLFDNPCESFRYTSSPSLCRSAWLLSDGNTVSRKTTER